MNKECLELKKIVKMCFAQIKDRRFSELKILHEMKNAKLVGPSLVYILCFRLTKSAHLYFKVLKIISWTNFFVLQLTIIYFPKFREDHPGFWSPNNYFTFLHKAFSNFS